MEKSGRVSSRIPGWVEILQILAGEEQGGLLLTYALEAVADVGDDGGIGQPQVQLVNSRHGIAQQSEADPTYTTAALNSNVYRADSPPRCPAP